MQEDLISIIVPVYKVEKYLDRCITSIVNQTYKNLEIILVDDGSPDNCPQMCDDWAKKDNRIKVIHKENGGVSSARNDGLRIAGGSLVGFVDSDDWVDSGMYEYLHNLMKKHNADISSVGFFMTNADEADSEGEAKKERITVLNNNAYMKKFFKICSQETIYYSWNKLYKRQLIPADPFPLEFSVGEDVISTFLMIRNATSVVESDKKMYYYRQNSGITSHFNKAIFDLQKVWDVICELTKSDNEILHRYAVVNRKRIPFTILSELAISGEYKNYLSNVDSLVKELKCNKKDLLSENIAISRKLLMVLFCVDYKLCAKALSIMRLIKG